MSGPASRQLVAFLSLAAGLLAVAPLQGQGTITGTVTDSASGAPVFGARLQAIAPDGRVVAGTLSNDNGRYRLGPLPAGPWTVTAARIGYAPLRGVRTTIRDNQPVVLNLVLAGRPEPAAEIIVTASRQPETNLQAPASTSVITREQVAAADHGDADRSPLRRDRHGRREQGTGPAHLHRTRFARGQHRLLPHARRWTGPDPSVDRLQHPVPGPGVLLGRGSHRGGPRPGGRHLRSQHRTGCRADLHALGVRCTGDHDQPGHGRPRPLPGRSAAGGNDRLQARLQAHRRVPRRHRLGVRRYDGEREARYGRDERGSRHRVHRSPEPEAGALCRRRRGGVAARGRDQVPDGRRLFPRRQRRGPRAHPRADPTAELGLRQRGGGILEPNAARAAVLHLEQLGRFLLAVVRQSPGRSLLDDDGAAQGNQRVRQPRHAAVRG